MFILSLFIFALVMAGLLIVSNLNLDSMATDMDKLMNPEIPIAKKAYKIQKKVKDGFLKSTLQEIKSMMIYMGQSNKFIVVCTISIILAVLGIIAAIAIGNPYLIPALFVGFLSLPFIFVRLYSHSYTKHLQSELELSLSQITTSYTRTDDIISAIEENINNINPPVHKVFEKFLNQVKFINPNIRQAIDEMEDEIDDDIFKEWCEALKRCNQNRTLKFLLQPIVNKYSTLRSISSSIAEAMFEIKFQFFIIVGIVYLNYPLLYFLNKDWYAVLSSTTQGFVTTGIIALATVVCTIILTFLTKPIKYKI